MDEELRKKLDKRFQKSDPELYNAVVSHLDYMKSEMKKHYLAEIDAIQAQHRWIEKYNELADEMQALKNTTLRKECDELAKKQTCFPCVLQAGAFRSAVIKQDL